MSKDTLLYLVLASVAVYFLFLRKATITGGANIGVQTGNNQNPYPGYPPGAYPPGMGYGMMNGGGAAPPPPPASVDSGPAWLAASGQFIGALAGAAAGIVESINF